MSIHRPASAPGLAPRLALALAAACAPTLPQAAETAAAAPEAVAATELVVCADPANLPYSNERGEGFENRIASLLAKDLHATLRYEWNEQRRGFLRRGLNGRHCDLLLDVPADLEGVRTLRPLWTSTYAFVTRRDRALRIEDFDDARLKQLRIGLQAIGTEGINTPPATSIALRGLTSQVVGFPMKEASDRSASDLVAAVDAGSIDVAILWGPFAGYFARRHGERLDVVPVLGDARVPTLAYAYAMAPAVRRGDEAFGDRVQSALDRHATEIRELLASYGVPLLPTPTPATTPQ